MTKEINQDVKPTEEQRKMVGDLISGAIVSGPITYGEETVNVSYHKLIRTISKALAVAQKKGWEEINKHGKPKE